MAGYDNRESSKPCGNDYSLVPEISGRGVNGQPVPVDKGYGKAPDIKHSTLRKNNSMQYWPDMGNR